MSGYGMGGLKAQLLLSARLCRMLNEYTKLDTLIIRTTLKYKLGRNICSLHPNPMPQVTPLGVKLGSQVCGAPACLVTENHAAKDGARRRCADCS